MRNFFLLVFLCLSINNCASPVVPAKPVVTTAIGEASLFKIKISHMKKAQFSGIIGLEMRADGVYCILLDATGLSLFAGIVKSDGSIQLINSLTEINKKKLPELIASALWAVFLAPPDDNCPWYQLRCIERKKTREVTKKILTSRYFGFLQTWKATITLVNDFPMNIKYSLNLQKVDIEMKKIKE